MKVLTVRQMKKAEDDSLQTGLTYMRLMENAGASCAKRISDYIKNESSKSGKISILCGSGKNAGDGLVIARKLKQAGYAVNVIFLFDHLKSQETIDMYLRTDGLNIRFYKCSIHGDEIRFELETSDIIVDAVFGIGFKGEVDENTAKVFEIVNSSDATVFAIDVPSGLSEDGDNSIYVNANITLAIAALKPVHLINIDKIGKVMTVDIGIPEECYPENAADIILPSVKKIKKVLPQKNREAHKGDFGRAVLIVGSVNFQGAAVLSANACVRSGAGITQLIIPKAAYTAIASKVTEPIILPVTSNSDGRLSEISKWDIFEAIKTADAVLIGCGLGNDDETNKIVYEVIKKAECPLIIDADGINAVAKNINILKEAKVPIILTPHPGEMSRLTGEPIGNSVPERIMSALNFSKKYDDVVVVLKGANTIVARNSSPIFINTTGNNGMATGGSGDVLAGIITSLVAQSAELFDAALAGVYIHGLAGDRVAEKLSRRGMTPTDIIGELPYTFAEFE